MGFSGGSNDNEHAFRDLSLIPGLGISHGEREWQPTLVFLPGEFIMTNLDSTLKSRDITLPTKVLLVKAMVFPVVMYGCEIGP